MGYINPVYSFQYQIGQKMAVVYEEFLALQATIEDIVARPFPTFPIIEKILMDKVLYIQGTKYKEKTIVEEHREKKIIIKRRKYKDDV